MYRSTMQTKYGYRVHAIRAIQGRYSLCNLMVMKGDHRLDVRRKVTCKKCLKILDRLTTTEEAE